MEPGGKPSTWALRAAQNAVSTLPRLGDPGDDVPAIRVDDVAARIQAAFPDRQAWNAAIHESRLDGSVKIWLIVPDQ